MDKKSADSEPKTAETKADLKEQTVTRDPVQKGYNEKNPVQPEGAFSPDNKPSGSSNPEH